MSTALRAPEEVHTPGVFNIRTGKYITVPELAPDNRRWAKRRAAASKGELSGDDIGEPLACVVLDTSSTGARLKPHFPRAARCQSIKDLPARVTLMFVMDRFAVDCEICWRRDGEVGVRFVSPAREVPKPARMVAPARPKK